MALLSQWSVDKHIFERAPLSTEITQTTALSFTGSYRRFWSHTDIKLHTDTDPNSQYSRSTFKRDPPPPHTEKTIRDLPPLSAAMPTSPERTKHTSCKVSSKQQHFTSLSLHFPPEVKMKTGPHRLCIYIWYKTRCSNVYIHNTNKSIQLLIKLYIQSSKINMWWQNKQQISPFCSSLVWYSLKYTTASSAQSKNTKLYF